MDEEYTMAEFLADAMAEEQRVSNQNRKLIGKFAKVTKALRPQGCIRLDGKIIEVSSEGPYIPRGEEVQVIGVKDDKIIVR